MICSDRCGLQVEHVMNNSISRNISTSLFYFQRRVAESKVRCQRAKLRRDANLLSDSLYPHLITPSRSFQVPDDENDSSSDVSQANSLKIVNSHPRTFSVPSSDDEEDDGDCMALHAYKTSEEPAKKPKVCVAVPTTRPSDSIRGPAKVIAPDTYEIQTTGESIGASQANPIDLDNKQTIDLDSDDDDGPEVLPIDHSSPLDTPKKDVKVPVEPCLPDSSAELPPSPLQDLWSSAYPNDADSNESQYGDDEDFFRDLANVQVRDTPPLNDGQAESYGSPTSRPHVSFDLRSGRSMKEIKNPFAEEGTPHLNDDVSCLGAIDVSRSTESEGFTSTQRPPSPSDAALAKKATTSTITANLLSDQGPQQIGPPNTSAERYHATKARSMSRQDQENRVRDLEAQRRQYLAVQDSFNETREQQQAQIQKHQQQQMQLQAAHQLTRATNSAIPNQAVEDHKPQHNRDRAYYEPLRRTEPSQSSNRSNICSGAPLSSTKPANQPAHRNPFCYPEAFENNDDILKSYSPGPFSTLPNVQSFESSHPGIYANSSYKSPLWHDDSYQSLYPAEWIDYPPGPSKSRAAPVDGAKVLVPEDKWKRPHNIPTVFEPYCPPPHYSSTTQHRSHEENLARVNISDLVNPSAPASRGQKRKAEEIAASLPTPESQDSIVLPDAQPRDQPVLPETALTQETTVAQDTYEPLIQESAASMDSGPARKKVKTTPSKASGIGKFVSGIAVGIVGALATFIATIPASVREEALREISNVK